MSMSRDTRRTRLKQWRAFRSGFSEALGAGPQAPDEDDDYDDLAALCFGVLQRTGSVDDAIDATVRRHDAHWERSLSPKVVERLEHFLRSWPTPTDG